MATPIDFTTFITYLKTKMFSENDRLVLNRDLKNFKL